MDQRPPAEPDPSAAPASDAPRDAYLTRAGQVHRRADPHPYHLHGRIEATQGDDEILRVTSVQRRRPPG
jgi:hypothetical protein